MKTSNNEMNIEIPTLSNQKAQEWLSILTSFSEDDMIRITDELVMFYKLSGRTSCISINTSPSLLGTHQWTVYRELLNLYIMVDYNFNRVTLGTAQEHIYLDDEDSKATIAFLHSITEAMRGPALH